MSRPPSKFGTCTLTGEDAARMAALHAAAFLDDQVWSDASFISLLQQQSVAARGVVDDGDLVAMIVVQRAVDQAEILTLATRPSRRRQKLAGRLIEEFERDLSAAGVVSWRLDVAADNLGAIAFYEKNQFETDGRRPRYYKRLEGKRVDAILMSKRMARQAAT